MIVSFSKPILRSSLPHGFRKIRLELAREHGHLDGESPVYVVIAPLDAASHIDLKTWKDHCGAATVVRQRRGEPERRGHLTRTQSGAWAFDYDSRDSKPDELFRFADENLAIGEYVSGIENGKVHVYKVTSVERL
jgi:hypothetical protein